MAVTHEESDVALGFTVLFGLLSVFSAGILFFADSSLGAFGFGGALLFGSLLIAALHRYGA